MRALYKTEVENKRLIDDSFRKDFNLVNFHISNTEEHEMAKARVCYFLKKQDRLFLTEARFKGGKGRADIFDLTEGVAYEILHTEEAINLEEKRKVYPCLVIGLDSKKVLECSSLELETLLN